MLNSNLAQAIKFSQYLKEMLYEFLEGDFFFLLALNNKSVAFPPDGVFKTTVGTSTGQS